MKIEQFRSYKGDAILYESCSYSYLDLYEKIVFYEKKLEKLIGRNDVIIIESDYSFFSISMLLALSNFPCIIVPLVKTTDEEYRSKLIASNANKIISFDDNDDFKLIKIDDFETKLNSSYLRITAKANSGIVLFSSGTTGLPKVMVHNLNELLKSFELPRRQKSLRFLIFLMFDHIGGLNTLFGCLNNGSTIVIPYSRSPQEILNIIETHKIQILPTSPTFINMMLMTDEIKNKNLSSLKIISYGTERMSGILLEKLNNLLPNVKLLQTFGTSETGIMKTKSKSSSSLFFKIIDKNVEYKIKENQLYIKSKNSVNEYKDLKSDKFKKDGWFATGDIVELDKDDENYMKIIGRINNVINVGGLKVMPAEVEDVINSVNGVVDSTVMSKQHLITGQIVIARVVIVNGFDANDIKSKIKKACKLNLDKFKRPVKLIVENEIKLSSRFKKII